MNSNIETNPAIAISSAKNFIEMICKTILKKRNGNFDENMSVQNLVKETQKHLNFTSENVTDAANATEQIKKSLNGLSTVVHQIGEIRNTYGDGHGKNADFSGLQPKEARLVVNAATTLGVYLVETYNNQQTES